MCNAIVNLLEICTLSSLLLQYFFDAFSLILRCSAAFTERLLSFSQM